jgi:uncharacterized repeat protein (TIGR01451 family)
VDLAVTKTDSPDAVAAGSPLTYSIAITNNGPTDAAENVELSDMIPAGTTFVSFTAPAGWTSMTPVVGGTGTVTATNPSLAAGATANFTLVVQVDSDVPNGNTLTNTASVTNDVTDSNMANDSDTETTSVETLADLVVTKIDQTDPVMAGLGVIYEVTLTNSGPSDAQNVVLTDVTPAESTPFGFAQQSGPAFTLAFDGMQTFTATIATLAAGATAKFLVGTTIDDDLADGSIVANTATATSSTTDLNLTNNADMEQTTVEAVDLAVTKTDSPDAVAAGSLLTYSITVVNNALTTAAENIELSDMIPAGTTFVSFTAPAGWTSMTPPVGGTGAVTATIPSLAAGASATFTLAVQVDSDVADGSTLTNTASVANDVTDSNPANNADTETTSVESVADLVVTKTDGVDPVVAGSGVIYTLTLTNNGPSDAQNVVLTDVTPAESTPFGFAQQSGPAFTLAFDGMQTFTATIATLPAGATAVFLVGTTVDANVGDGSTIANTATATSSTTDLNLGNNSDTEPTTVIAAPDLVVTKIDSPDLVTDGSNLTYTITVTNNGPSDAAGIMLTDVVPANTTFVSFTAPAGWTSMTPAVGATGAITSSIASLAVGATATFTLVVNVNAGTPDGTIITNTATASSTSADPDPANNSDTEFSVVNVPVDLTVTKTDAPDPVIAGNELTYSITVTNSSGVTAAHNVELVDTVPAGTTFVSFTAPAGWTSMTPAVGGTGTVMATNPSLAAGAMATFTLVVKVDSDEADGSTITNTASVTNDLADADMANNADTETTGVDAVADIVINKTDSSDPVLPGQNITYTLSATNNGPSDAQNVILEDLVPNDTTFAGFLGISQGSATFVVATNEITATFGTIPSGATATLVFVVTADAAAPDGTLISNTVTGTTTTTDPNPANNSVTQTTTVTAVDLSITKTDSPDPVIAGNNLTYTFTVTNSATATAAQNVEVTDVIPAGTTFVSFTAPAGWTSMTPAAGGTGTVTATTPSLAAGATATFTLVVRVPSDTADGSTITNMASAVSDTVETDSGNNSATSTTLAIRRVDLVVAKSESADPVVAGSGTGNLVYTVTVTNNGPSDASGVVLSEDLTLPEGVSIDSIVPGGGTTFAPSAGPDGAWTVGDLPAGASRTLTVTLTVGASAAAGNDVISDTALVTAVDQAQVDTGNESAAAATSIVRFDLATHLLDGTTPVNSLTINEGQSVTLAGSFTNAPQAHTVQIVWGDGQSDTFTLAAGVFDFTRSHQYRDDIPSGTGVDAYSIQVTVTDAGGQARVDAGNTATVHNIPPIFSSLAINPASVPSGSQAGFSGTYTDPGILDAFVIDVDLDGNGTFDFPSIPVSGGAFSFNLNYNLPPGAYMTHVRLRDDDGGATSGTIMVTVTPPSVAVVADSRLFYNNSSFDGNNPAGNAADANAIDASKVLLAIGQAATFANISGYTKGINGVTFVVNNLPADGANLTPADFAVRLGTTNNINSWAAGPAPSVTVLANSAPGGGDRVLLTFADNVIQDTYAAFQILASANTGLAAAHTAIFGNVRGETGASFQGQGVFFGRGAEDLQAMAQPGVLFQPAAVTSATDINKSGLTDAFDFQGLALAGIQLNVLPVITPAFAAAPAAGFASAAVTTASLAAPLPLALASDWPLFHLDSPITLHKAQAARDAAVRQMHDSQAAASSFVPHLERIDPRFAHVTGVGDYDLALDRCEQVRNHTTAQDLVLENLAPRIGGILR